MSSSRSLRRRAIVARQTYCDGWSDLANLTSAKWYGMLVSYGHEARFVDVCASRRQTLAPFGLESLYVASAPNEFALPDQLFDQRIQRIDLLRPLGQHFGLGYRFSSIN